MKNNLYKKILIPAISGVAMLSFFVQAGAQTESADIPENLAPLARELGCSNQEECAKVFDSNFEKSIELAEKHGVYNADQQKMAKSFKQEVINKLNDIGDDNFEEEIVKIAQEILKKPSVAKVLKVDKEEVKAAETIISEVKNAGAGVEVCSRPASSLSREELIACLEASKKLARQSDIIGKYIPKGISEKAKMLDATVGLEEALAKGEYADMGKTAEEVGQKCLRPGSESLKTCDEIAEKYFGPQGVKELAAARAQTKQAGDFYLQSLANLELITPDGQKVAGKEAIRKTCDTAFQRREVKIARACGEFAVKNGLANKEEVEEGLKIFESFASKSQINFDDCRNNPESCKEFIPEEFKKDFDSEMKIFEIMKKEMGFDPRQCERSNFDLEIGKKCFEASKKVLPKLKELAKEHPEAQRIISEIEFGMKEEERHSQKQEDFIKVFQNQGGPGGCKSERECFAYCSDSANGAECISFGAKHEVFGGAEAVERYQKYNNTLNVQQSFFGEPYQVGAPGTYNNQQGGTSNGSGSYQNNLRQVPPPPFYNEGNFGGPAGPSPECFSAIKNGDFAKAKEICNAPTNAYQYRPYVPPNRGICPAIPNIPCPTGTRRVDRVTPEGCGVYECVADNYEVRCAADQYWKVTGSGGQGYCAQKESYSSYPYDPKEKCYREGGTWAGDYCRFGRTYNSSSAGQNYSSGSYYSSGNVSSYGYPGSCSSELANLLGSGCHYMYNDSSGNPIYCNGEMTRSAKRGDAVAKEGCASSGGYGNYSSSGSYPGDANSCPGFSYSRWDSSGRRYCQLNNERKCDYNYPSYLTNETNYKTENCPADNNSSGTGNWSSYSYSSYNYTTPSGQREQIWNSYGLRSWVRTDADTARIERLKQACSSVTSSSSDIWMPGAGNFGSVDFGMPDESRCKAWTPNSQASYSSYGYGGGSYSSYSYSYPQCDWSTQYLKNSTQSCMPKTDCYNTANVDYNSSECQGVRGYTSGYSSSYGSYNSYSSASSCPTNLLGSGCHDMGSAYFNSAMDQYVIYGGSTIKNCTAEYINGCTSWGNSSSYSTGGSYSSYSYSSYSTGGSYSSYGSGSYSSYSDGGGSYSSSYDASAACTQSGGSWNGSSCVTNTVSSAATDPSAACAQAGGTWDGTTCAMPGSTTLNKNGSLIASLSQTLKGIFEGLLH